MLKNTHMHIFFGAEKPTHMVRTYPYVKYIEYPPRDSVRLRFHKFFHSCKISNFYPNIKRRSKRCDFKLAIKIKIYASEQISQIVFIY